MLWWAWMACSAPTPPASSGPPGVTDAVVTVGTVLPVVGDDEAATLGRAARDVLVAALGRAEVHGRSVELVVRHAAVGEALDAAKALVEEEEVFALLAPQASGEEAAFVDWAEEAAVPVVAPFGGRPASEGVGPVFWLYGGPEDQARAVVQDVRPRRMAVVAATEGPAAARAEAAVRQAARVSMSLERVTHAEACGALELSGIEAVLLEGPLEEARAWLAGASAEQCGVDLYLLSDRVPPLLGDGQVPWFGRLYSASASRPLDWTPRGVADLVSLVGDDVEPTVRPVQVAAYAAASLFLEGLERAGETPDRSGLQLRLASTQNHRTGLTPTLSFGPRRRVGALGAWIVERDPRSAQPLGDESERWVTPR